MQLERLGHRPAPESAGLAERTPTDPWGRLQWCPGSALLRVALFAVVILAPGEGIAVPIGSDSVDLSDPAYVFLDYALDGGFTVSFTEDPVNLDFGGYIGDQLHFKVDLTLAAPAQYDGVYEGGLMVFTSIRLGNTTPLNCADPNSYPTRLPFVVTNIVAGDAIQATDPIGPSGQMCDLEDDPIGVPSPFGNGVQFLAFRFDGNPGDSYQIAFDVTVTDKDLSDAEYDLLFEDGFLMPFRGFAVIPEPSTLPLVLSGLGALAASRRVRKA